MSEATDGYNIRQVWVVTEGPTRNVHYLSNYQAVETFFINSREQRRDAAAVPKMLLEFGGKFLIGSYSRDSDTLDICDQMYYQHFTVVTAAKVIEERLPSDDLFMFKMMLNDGLSIALAEYQDDDVALALDLDSIKPIAAAFKVPESIMLAFIEAIKPDLFIKGFDTWGDA